MLAVVLLSSGCGGGGALPSDITGGKHTLAADIALPDKLIHGQSADWRVSVNGGTPPYTVDWNLGGGAVAPAAAGTDVTLTMNGDDWQTLVREYQLTITDSAGNRTELSGAYEVLPEAGAPHALKIISPPVMHGSADAAWRVEWQGDSVNCHVGWRMNGGALDVSLGSTASGVGEDVQEFSMVNFGDVSETRTVEVKVIDDDGYYMVESLDYIVEPAIAAPEPELPGPPPGDQPPGDDPGPGNSDPEVVAFDFDADYRDLVVEVADEEDGVEGLLVTIELPSAFFSDGSCTAFSDAGGRAVFHLIPYDVFIDSIGKAKVTVTDSAGDTGRAETMVLTRAWPLELDVLYAIPLTRQARVGETVRVVVATGPLRYRLAFLNGVSLQTLTGAEYIPYSMNIGDIGGLPKEADGFWEALNPSDFIQPKEEITTGLKLDDDRTFWEFNVTPITPQDYHVSRGSLFNIEMIFSAPGEYKLGFIKSHVVDRTFYTSQRNERIFWDDISNEHEGIWNTVVVTE